MKTISQALHETATAFLAAGCAMPEIKLRGSEIAALKIENPGGVYYYDHQGKLFVWGIKIEERS